MNAIARRLQKLEQQGVFVETEESRLQRERIEEFVRRTDEWRASRGYPPEPDDNEDLSSLTLAEVINRGRRSRETAARVLLPVKS